LDQLNISRISGRISYIRPYRISYIRPYRIFSLISGSAGRIPDIKKAGYPVGASLITIFPLFPKRGVAKANVDFTFY
jgi:hypothetical protein